MDETLAAGRRPAFAIFEGGGAKGVAHVGALDALAANGFELIGVAGSSAGAIAAALVAIGLEAADIMHATERSANIIARYNKTPIDLLGADDWRALNAARGKAEKLGTAKWAFGKYNAWLGLQPAIDRLHKQQGLMSTEHIAAFVEQVIRDRLEAIKAVAPDTPPIPDKVTFGDLAAGWPTVIPLKIVATDLERGVAEIFDATRTPGVVVAEAVAASIAIPMVFEPARIPSFSAAPFADGGLVANLPIWVFAESKLAHERENPGEPPVPIIGFSLQGTGPKAKATSPIAAIFDYGAGIAQTALSGSQGSAHRFVDDVTIIDLKVKLDLLAFDAEWEAFAEAREAGRRQASRQLDFKLRTKPALLAAALGEIQCEALALINAGRATAGRPPVAHLRTNLVRPQGDLSLRVVAGVNMDGDADDRLLLDQRGRGAAQAFRERGLRVVDLGVMAPGAEYMTKYERALLRPALRSLLAIPIFADNGNWLRDDQERDAPLGVFSLDSDEELGDDFAQKALLDLLIDKSSVLAAALTRETDDG